MKGSLSPDSDDICRPQSSGWLLLIGLIICLPLFYYWGNHIQIEPVRVLHLGEDGVLKVNKKFSWSLNPKEAKSIELDEEGWVELKDELLKGLAPGDYKIKWKEKNLWALIKLELF